MSRKSREKRKRREEKATLTVLTPRKRLAAQLVQNIKLTHNSDSGLDEVDWVPDAPKDLVDAFEKVVDYDAWRCEILRQYAWYVVHDLDMHMSPESWAFPSGLEEQSDWLKADTSRALYVEKAEISHKYLAQGEHLSSLFRLAQEAEISHLIPKFDDVMDRLTEGQS